MSAQAQDDAFHEIQLNGKQLVFLFMAATVVSVVIFLCGVFVGRGVRAERAAVESNESLAITEPPPQQAPHPAQAQTPPAQAQDLTSAAPPPVPAEDRALSYFDRLEKGSSSEALKPVPAPQRTAAGSQPRPAQAPPPAPAPKPVAAAAKTVAAKPVAAPPGDVAPPAPAPAAASAHDGYAIQVAALRESGEADTIAKRLVSKGYDAYVLTPPGGTPSVYRVRVGSFKTRRDAEAIATKLQQEEQFKPWITR